MPGTKQFGMLCISTAACLIALGCGANAGNSDGTGAALRGHAGSVDGGFGPHGGGKQDHDGKIDEDRGFDEGHGDGGLRDHDGSVDEGRGGGRDCDRNGGGANSGPGDKGGDHQGPGKPDGSGGAPAGGSGGATSAP